MIRHVFAGREVEMSTAQLQEYKGRLLTVAADTMPDEAVCTTFYLQGGKLVQFEMIVVPKAGDSHLVDAVIDLESQN